ncbi:Severe Depolymerization of Actin, partial [Dispira parvispora]
MGRRRRAALLPTNLPQLQNLIKRDPSSYQEEFMQQWKHFESSLVLLKLKPDEESKKFSELVMFLAQVCHCYAKQCATFPDQIIELLQEQYSVLHFELRRSLVQCLILLRNKNFIPGSKTLALFFTLFRCHDKVLRELLYKHIVNDIRTANLKHKNNKLNKTLQNFMFTMLQSVNTAEDSNRQASSQAKVASGGDNAMAAKKSLDVCIELYRKNVWNDAKTVNIIATACFSPVSKILATAVKFFLGCDDPEQDGSDAEDEDGDVGRPRRGMADLRSMQHRQRVGKKTRSKARQYDKVLATVKRKDNQSKRVETFNFSAIHLINDPQQFADRLYGRLHQVGSQKHSTVERFEVRLMVMKLISRLIGTHQLL